MDLEYLNKSINKEIVTGIISRLGNIHNQKVKERFGNENYLDLLLIDYNLQTTLEELKILLKSILDNPENQKRTELYLGWTDEDIMITYYCLFGENLDITITTQEDINYKTKNILHN